LHWRHSERLDEWEPDWKMVEMWDEDGVWRTL